MAQQVVARPVQEDKYFERSRKVNTWTFSDQNTTISGEKFTTGTIANQTFFNITTAPFNLVPNFKQTVILQTFNHFVIRLDHIKTDGKVLPLAKPIMVTATYQDNMYSCRNEELGVVSVSAKLKDCIEDFEEEIVFLLREYGKESDSRLTDDAKELKRMILNHFK